MCMNWITYGLTGDCAFKKGIWLLMLFWMCFRNPTGGEEEEDKKNTDEEDGVFPPAYDDLYPALPSDNDT